MSNAAVKAVEGGAQAVGDLVAAPVKIVAGSGAAKAVATVAKWSALYMGAGVIVEVAIGARDAIVYKNGQSIFQELTSAASVGVPELAKKIALWPMDLPRFWAPGPTA